MYKTMKKYILYVLEENLRYNSFLPVIYICSCLNFDLVQLSGFKMEVIETAYAGHAKVLSSTVDLQKFPDGNINCVSLFSCSFLFGNQIPFYFTIQDAIFFFLFTGIICVGGDGIVNEVISFPIFLSFCIENELEYSVALLHLGGHFVCIYSLHLKL